MKTASSQMILLLVIGLSCSPSIFAETVTLVAIAPANQTATSSTITVASSEVATLVFSDGAGDLNYIKGGGSFSFGFAARPVVVGPASIYLSVGGSTIPTKSLATFSIVRASDQFVPSNAVVIPADSSGPVTIVLESSTDLLNWTPALPGTYGTTTTNRFFRVRAQR